MSTTNNPSNNQIGSASNNTVLSHENLNSTPGQWDSYNDQVDSFGFFSGVGTPEGVVAANTGSWYTDTGVGATGVYYKTTDTLMTGWRLQGSASSAILQTVNATQPNHDTNNTNVILIDNSIPQIGEGDEHMTLTITPTRTDSEIFLEFNTFASIASGGSGTVALFRSLPLQNDALKAVTLGTGANAAPSTIQFVDSPGVTTAVTYTIRFGPTAAIDMGLNAAAAGGSAYGNAALSNLRATEYNPSFTPSSVNGKVVQVQEANRTTTLSTTAVIPLNNTEPQNNEGTSFLTLSFTPLNSSNNLRIEVYGFGYAAGNQETLTCTISDLTTIPSDSLVAGIFIRSPSVVDIFTNVYQSITVSAGSTLARTYDWRFGSSLGNSVALGGSGVNFYGVSSVSTIRVTELTP